MCALHKLRLPETGLSARWRLFGLPAVMAAFLLASFATLAAPPPSPGGPCSAGEAPGAATRAPAITVPAGSEIYLRLKTPVSTTSSHLDETVEAGTARAVEVHGGIAIPAGAILIGRIAQLVPFARPERRARLLLQFNRLKLPGRKPIPVACRVRNVDNAREKVLADGTIRGILARESPVRLLYSALRRMENRSGPAPATQKDPEIFFARPKNAIRYPSGTEFSVVLDQALRVSGHFKPAFARRIPRRLKEEVTQFLAQAPRRIAARKGQLAGPVNVVLIGAQAEIQAAFEKAGWTAAQKENARSVWKTFEALMRREGYGAAPMSTLYLYGRQQDMAFEKVLNTFAKRDHLRV